MPTKKGSLSYYAAQLRDTAQRRIRRLEKAANDATATERVREWSKKQINRLEQAAAQTKRKRGWQKNKAESDAEIGRAMRTLSREIYSVAPNFKTEGDTFAVTQQQLNLAKAKRPSMYTESEVDVFYKATQKIWDKKTNVEDEKKPNRNELIMEHFNSIRAENGLKPLSLSEIIDFTLRASKKGLEIQNADPSKRNLTDAEREIMDVAQTVDASDQQIKYDAIGQAIVNQVRDAFAALFTMPEPTQLTGTDIKDFFEG